MTTKKDDDFEEVIVNKKGARVKQQDDTRAASTRARKTGTRAKRTLDAEIRPKTNRLLIPFILLDSVLILGIIVILLGFSWFKKTYGVSVMECWEDAVETIEESDESDFTLNNTSLIYDSSGNLLVTLSDGDSSTYLTYNEIPEEAICAMVAIEDRSFWTNMGFSVKGIARATLSTISGSVSGGSTITQQLCKLIYLSSEKSILRKVKEIFLAYNLTQTYSKEKIMEWYINNCCFANGIYGLNDAAKAYFDKEASELNLTEIVYLCAIPNWPEHYDPWKDPEEALGRSKRILQSMLELNYITQAEFETALNTELLVTGEPKETHYGYDTSYAIYCATEAIMKKDGFTFQNEFTSEEEYQKYQDAYSESYNEANHKLQTGGYTVYTSLDRNAQKAIQEALDVGLADYTEVGEDNIYDVQGAVTVIDNESGKVLAIVGGRTQENSALGYNRAWQFNRQPGSVIKPLSVYLPALELGYTADTKIKDIDVQEAYKVYQKGGSIQDLPGTSFSLRYALEQSLNGVALMVYDDITPKVGMSYLISLGFRNLVPNDYYLSGALGGFTYGTTTVEMANAYSTIANYGQYRETSCIVSMLDRNGDVIYKEPKNKTVYKSKPCVEMTDILTGVLLSGTANEIDWYASSSIPAAGKTGTTNNSVDGWFVGYTSDYSVAVWVGRDDNKAVENLDGGTYPAEVWKSCMLWLTENREPENMVSIFDDITSVTDDSTHDSGPDEARVEENDLSNELPDSQRSLDKPDSETSLDKPDSETSLDKTETWHLNTDASIRDAPSSTNSTILFALAAGTDVQVVDMQTYWTEILVDGEACYVYTPFLSKGSVQP